MIRAEGKFLEIWNLCKTYVGPDRQVHQVVEGFTLNVARGEFVSIIGHSGCGKSTVLSMVAGLNPPTSGSMILAGRELTGPGLDRGVVFQSPHLLPWLSALDNLVLGIEQAFSHRTRTEQRAQAQRYLDLVGLADAADCKPDELSQGMRQRVGLARAFALEPRMLLLDEPFGMLDSLTRLDLQQILVELWSHHRQTALLVTHDVDEALLLSDRVVMMTSGPEARVGDVLVVPFARPRRRDVLLESEEYYDARDRLLGFLEEQGSWAEAPRPSES